MSACDIPPVRTVQVRADNALQLWADQLSGVVLDILEGQSADMRRLEDALRTIRNWPRRSVDPLQLPWLIADNVLWNTYLDVLIALVNEVEQHIRDLQEAATDAAEQLQRVLAEAGNPGALIDVASGLRMVAEAAFELTDNTTPRDLAADDAWHGKAAAAYRERSQDQRDLGFEPLGDSASSIAEALDAMAGAQCDFWQAASALVTDAIITIAGAATTLAGLVATVVGIAAAPPTAGVSLIVTVVGVVTSIIGLCISAVGGWRLVNAWTSLVDGTEQTLTEQSSVTEAARDGLDTNWPVLAV